MNGIDISNHQKGINLSVVPCDFVIIKATQGQSYISGDFRRQIEQALSLNKLVGVYHYANGVGVDAEAEHFYKTIKSYLGRVIIALDWEGEQNRKFSDYHYCEDLLDAIKAKTGLIPFLYMSKSVARQYKWERGRNYPFWCAQYANKQKTGYKTNPWTDDKGFGAWQGCEIYQYSSKGRLNGYNDDLDLDLAYIGAEEWNKYANGTQPYIVKPVEYRVLKKGSRGEDVRAWQTFLNLNGYACGTNDGIFGVKTEKAVKAWQKAHPECGKVDGIIGAKTWASLPFVN